MKLLLNKTCGLNCLNVVNLFTRSLHIYKDINPWKDHSEFAQYLLKNVLYYENGLLALNKPFGITFSRGGITPQEKPPVENKKVIHHKDPTRTVINKTIEETLMNSGISSNHLSLVGALPYLKKELGLKKLYIAKVPERYTSGVALLATDKDVIERVQRCVLRAVPAKEAMDTYHTIVMGKPRYTDSEIKVGLKLDTSEKMKKEKKPVILKEWSRKSVKRQEVIVAKFYYKTLTENSESNTCLIEVASNRRKWHCIRLFCATYLLSPVLGDNIYAGRVKSVMGVSVPIDHWSPASFQPQKFSQEFLKFVDIPRSETGVIPLHLHLSQTLLKSYDGKGKDLIITAPLPDFFTWTCQRLGLDTESAVTQLKYKALG